MLNTPEGIFGNPQAIPQCTSVDFAQESCPSSSQAGLITIHARYNGDPNALLGTAPIYDIVPSPEQTALFAFIVPILNIPIQIPVAVRTADDYGLRFTVSEITQTTPLAGADLTFWGFPAASSHDGDRFPKGSPGRPAGCAGIADTSCLATPTPAAITVHPLIENPTTCSGEPLVTRLSVQTYQDPDNSSEAQSSYPAVTGCEKELFKPLLYVKPTSTEADSASGLDISINDQQFLGFAASPAAGALGGDRLPTGPDGQPRRRRRPERLHRRPGPLRHRGRRRSARTRPRSGRSRSPLRRWPGRFRARSTSANRSPATSTG